MSAIADAHDIRCRLAQRHNLANGKRVKPCDRASPRIELRVCDDICKRSSSSFTWVRKHENMHGQRIRFMSKHNTRNVICIDYFPLSLLVFYLPTAVCAVDELLFYATATASYPVPSLCCSAVDILHRLAPSIYTAAFLTVFAATRTVYLPSFSNKEAADCLVLYSKNNK